MTTRERVLKFLSSMNEQWISHSDLRQRLGLTKSACCNLMARLEREGLVVARFGLADDGNGRRKQMRHYTGKGGGVSLDICSVAWLGTYCPVEPRGEGIVHRCEDDGEEYP